MTAPALTAQPHSLEAERAVLGAVLIEGAGALRDLDALAVDDLMTPAHRLILEAMRGLRARNVPPDLLTLVAEMTARGTLGRLDGGTAYLVGIGSGGLLANLPHYVGIVRDLAARRRTIALAAELASRAYTDTALSEIVDESRARLDDIGARASSSAWPTVAERVRALATTPVPRIAMPWCALNEATRGGLRAGVTIFAAPPGAGKTTAIVQMAGAAAARGVPTTILAADEPVDDILVRLGQAEGYPRDDIDERSPAVIAALADLLDARYRDLALLDGDDATVEDAVAELTARAAGRTPLLIVDSLQTARAVGSRDAETPRARVDAVIVAARRAARAGIPVIASSEVSRGSYRSRDPAQRIDPLASPKESGGAEHAAHLLVSLSPVAGEEGIVEATTAKNRWGRPSTWRWRVDHRTSTLVEVEAPAATVDAQPDAASQLAQDIIRARSVLAETPGVAGRWALAALLRGMSKSRQSAAVAALWDAGEVEDRGAARRPRWHLVPASSPGSPLALPGTGGTVHSPALPTPYRGGRRGGSKSGESGETTTQVGRGESDREDVV